MNEQQNYLGLHYQTLELLAKACSISPEELDTLVSQQLIPAPSYTVINANKCISQAFGELTASELRPGKYFHLGNKVWAMIAVETKNEIAPSRPTSFSLP
jgi:hypothetical protein